MYILILFAVSLSLDAAAVGFSYGIKNIKLPAFSLFVLFLASVLMSAAGTLFGGIVSSFFRPEVAKWLSFSLLVLLGLWMLVDSFREKEIKKEPQQEKTFEFVLKSMGLSVKIIKHPVDCDFDRSAAIDILESIYLAFLLSIDAVCSCASLAVGGNNAYITPVLVGLFQTAFLFTGSVAGKHLSSLKFFNTKVATLLPGAILIGIALFRLFSV